MRAQVVAQQQVVRARDRRTADVLDPVDARAERAGEAVALAREARRPRRVVGPDRDGLVDLARRARYIRTPSAPATRAAA